MNRDGSNDGGFAASLDDYEYWQGAIPHNNEFQLSVGKAIQEFFGGSNLSSLLGLEIGCGTGMTTDVILRSHPGIKLFSIDKELSMVLKSRKRFEDMTNVYFSCGDALFYLQMNLSRMFDFVATAYVLHNLDRSYSVPICREIYRVLKPGRPFVNADKFSQDDDLEHRACYDWQIAQIEKFDGSRKSSSKSNLIKHYEEDDKIRIRESEYMQTLKDIGFRDVRRTYREKMEATIVAIK